MSNIARRGRWSIRRGMSLVEVMVLMTAVATMLGICVMVLGLTMRLDADGRAAFERAESLSRLSGRFREDIHPTRDVSLDGRVLKLGPARGDVVEYRLDDRGVTRVVVRGGKDMAREPYRIPQTVATRFELREAEGREFASLLVEIQPRQERIDPVRTVEIEALVGKTAPPPEMKGGRL